VIRGLDARLRLRYGRVPWNAAFFPGGGQRPRDVDGRSRRVGRRARRRAAAPWGGPGISDRVISYSRLNETRDIMGKVTRKRYGAELKAKVALEAI